MRKSLFIFLLIFSEVSFADFTDDEEIKFCTFSYMHYGRPHTYFILNEEAMSKGELAYECAKPSKVNALDGSLVEEFVNECKSFLFKNIECAELETEVTESLRTQVQNIQEGKYTNIEGMPYFRLNNE